MCEFCEKGKNLKTYTAFRVEEYAGVWAITNFGTGSREWVKINFCPMCGRKLNGE